MPGVGGLMAVHAEALELQLLASGSDASRRRFQHLRRLLFVADAITGARQRRARRRGRARERSRRRWYWSPCSRSPGRSPPSCAGSTPARTCARGRAASARRRKLVLTCLRGLVAAVRAARSLIERRARPRPARSSARSPCAVVAGFARSAARMTAHRTPAAAPAHADRRLGRSSPSRLAERIQRPPRARARAHRLHRRPSRGSPGAADLPYLGGLAGARATSSRSSRSTA